MEKSSAKRTSSVRQVWERNLVDELKMISKFSHVCGYVSIDTEFPGTLWEAKQPLRSMWPEDHYRLMRKNVNDTKIIQLGLTLSNSEFHYVWEFNFRDFDRERDAHDPDSVALLEKQGIDFSTNKRDGIDGYEFGQLFARCSGLVGPHSRTRGQRAWITFHGLYDFGYLVRIMSGRPLPERLGEFIWLLRHYFGGYVYDLKPIAHGMQLRGGLEKVAKALGVERSVGKTHQAGSDSVLTMEGFLQLITNRPDIFMDYRHLLYGLTWLPLLPSISN